MKLRDLLLSTRITISFLAVLIAGTAALMFVENARLRDVYLVERRAHLEKDLEAEKLRLNQAINTLRQDVLFLSNAPPVPGIVRAALNRGYDPRYGNTHQVWAERLQQIFSAFSVAHPDYYQIRYIGVADGGRELVQIDNRAGKIEVTPPDRLQAKGDRDYFKATMGLHAGEVYLSEFNLDQELDVIDQSRNPALRAATPVFTPSGELFGMVVVNMDAGSLLKFAVSDMPGVQTYITNRNGQYLLHPDSQQAFKFEQGSKDKITTDFPFIKTMFDSPAPDYLPLQLAATKPARPLFAARRIRFDSNDPSRFLLLMYSIPGAAAEQQVATIPVQTAIYELLVMLLIGGIALLALRRAFAPLKRITAAAREITTGNRQIRLTETADGEIGELANALNSMLDKLSESEERFRGTFEQAAVGIAHAALDGHFQQVNKKFCEIVGYARDELLHMSFHDITVPDDLGQNVNYIQRLLAGEIATFAMEKRYVRKDRRLVWVKLTVSLWRDVDGTPKYTIGVIEDITDRKAAEQQLHDLTEHLQSVREEEKAGIAREIHDDLGGTLTALKLETYLLKTELSANNETRPYHERIREMSQLINNASSVMRHIITGLRPSILDDLGLLAAIEWQAVQFQKRTGIECRVNCIGDKGDLDKLRSVALFRIAQEALTNVSRHSGASRVEIEFHHSDEEVVMSIIDNGRGVTENRTDASIPYGMLGMIERVDQMGGKINFDTPPTGGFNVTVILPLPASEEEKKV